MSALLDLNYEEVSPDRNIDNGNWSNGLQISALVCPIAGVLHGFQA